MFQEHRSSLSNLPISEALGSLELPWFPHRMATTEVVNWPGRVGRGRRQVMLVHIFLMRRMALFGLPSSLMTYRLFLEVLLSLEHRRLLYQMITTEAVR
jgi:hypothetical protein